MFCKHCGHKLTNSDTVCPGCGTQIDPAVFGVQNFKVQLPSHEKELQELLEKADAQKASSAPPEVVDLPEEAAMDLPKAQPSAASRLPEPEDKAPAAAAEPQDIYSDSSAQELRRQTPVVSTGRTTRPYLDLPAAAPVYVPQRETRTARRSRRILTAVVCLCLAVMIGLLAVRLNTTLFDSSNSGLEPVSVNVLTDEEKTQILSCLTAYAPLFDRPFKPQTLGVGAFFDLLDLNRTNNLYAAVKGQPARVTDTADPLNRFADGEGGFSYYSISQNDLNAVAAQFGLSLPGSGQNSSYYSSDGAYYFAADREPSGDPALDLHVGKAQHTEDGNYYVALADLSDTDAVYAIVSRSTDAAEADWTLLELSPEPLFREDGTRTAPQTVSLNYEMRHESISATAADGTVYANYVLDYPYFTDQTAETAKTINALYAQMLASYQELAQSADKNYTSFVKHEYDKRLLPGYTYMVSTVTYNADGTVSLLDELTEYLPEVTAKALKAQQTETPSAAQDEPQEIRAADFVMPTITYSGTTIDTASGAFLRRDDVFSGDFEWYQSLLYRVFSGADEEELDTLIRSAGTPETSDPAQTDPYAPTISEDVTAMTETTATAAAGLPALSDAEAAIGQQIYASPWVRTPDGIRFCYLGNGYYTYVTLPQKYVQAED